MGFIIELSLYADVCLEELWENSLSELVCQSRFQAVLTEAGTVVPSTLGIFDSVKYMLS